MIPTWVDEKAASWEALPPVNRMGLTSLLCGSLALLSAALPYLQLLSLALSVAGLILGSLAIARSRSQAGAGIWERGRGILFPAAGLAVSLPAFCLAVFAVASDGSEEASENRQKLIPLRNPVNAEHREGDSEAELGNEIMWADASKDAVQHGDVRVRLVSAGVQPVELKEASGKKRLGERCLVIKLRISNAGAGQLIQYSGWDQPASDGLGKTPVVHDSNGKTYERKVFASGQEVVGHVSKWSLPPGKWLDDILVFEAVPARVEFLRLELPCQAFQEEGTIGLQIPGRMIIFKARE